MIEAAAPGLPTQAVPPIPATRPAGTTFFAPAGRDTQEELRRKIAVIEAAFLLRQALDAMPTMVMVLNANRQIVASNRTLLDVLNTVASDVTEKRPGEAIGCIRAKEGPDGCGTAPHCVTCGAVNAILDSQKGNQRVVRECRIQVQSPDGVAPMDLRVTATPLFFGDDRFIVTAIEDISQGKRLEVLQRTFFHDVLNTAGCIQGHVQSLLDECSERRDSCQRLVELTGSLIESIQTQRDLVQAEAGDLEIRPEVLHTRALLDELRLQYRKHAAAADREIALGDVWEGIVVTDRQLLRRVLGNMLKNALEATAPGGTVTFGCDERPEGVVFSVHNAEVMPDEVRLQIFQRSFSTKREPGRGIGTYSMKLFGERYLQGKVALVSQVPDGTTFTLTIPRGICD
jgi:PAS domain-containing protein